MAYRNRIQSGGTGVRFPLSFFASITIGLGKEKVKHFLLESLLRWMVKYLSHSGLIAQSGERFLHTEEVSGSIPLKPTILEKRL